MLRSRFARATDGAQLAVQVEGSGPLLVLVSGLGGLGEYWAPLVPSLRDSFRIVTYDHRGVGASSRTDTGYSLQEMSADLLSILNQLTDDSVTVIGHSMGGALAQRLAIEHPHLVRRLVLSATWARASPDFRRLFEHRLQTLNTLGLQAYLEQSASLLHTAHWLALNPPAMSAEAPRDALAESILRHKIAAILAHDSLDHLHRIQCPALTVVAADDVVTPPHLSQAIARRIPGCRSETLPRGGHYVLHEQTQTYVRAVVPFLTATPPVA